MDKPGDMAELVTLRRELHRRPELSGHEAGTAARIAAALAGCGARLVQGLGGAGLAAVFDSGQRGPSVMFRAELDALPINETGAVSWRSTVPGRGHLCGHDGHMAILVGLARRLARRGPARGRVVLLFQPAEETGAGARAVRADTRFAALRCDWAFALHNLPGVPQGRAWLAPGVVNCASAGMVITLLGKTSHASVPEAGVSPALALVRLIPALQALGAGAPAGAAPGQGFRLATVTHARLGERALGIAPGWAELLVTLRTIDDDGLDAILAQARALAEHEAGAAGLGLEIAIEDAFAACANHPEATSHMAAALDACTLPHEPGGLPMRASEDFGLFGHDAKAAMVFLGAGEGHPMLHNPDYDFPDALIAPGVDIFTTLARRLCG
ncbi:MAG: amidohydrolase [Pararhodobacter sp.]|nr:amidohydrolase [Pararhodobacter sp.]